MKSIDTKFDLGDKAWLLLYKPLFCKCCGTPMEEYCDIAMLTVFGVHIELTRGKKVNRSYSVSPGYSGTNAIRHPEKELYLTERTAKCALTKKRKKNPTSLCPKCAAYMAAQK